MIDIDETKLRKQPWDFQTTELRVGELTEPTPHKCVVCEKPILKVYSTEIDKTTGDIVTAVLTWNQRYTCSRLCKYQWLRTGDEGLGIIGNASRNKEGVPLYRAAKDPWIEEQKASGQTVKWGHSLAYKKVEVGDMLKEQSEGITSQIDDIAEAFANSDPDYFSVDTME